MLNLLVRHQNATARRENKRVMSLTEKFPCAFRSIPPRGVASDCSTPSGYREAVDAEGLDNPDLT
jgi:hypothetical protein